MRFEVMSVCSPSRRDDPPSDHRGAAENQDLRRRRKWLTALIAGFVVVSVASGLIVTHWPYSERMIVPSLEDTLKARVTVQRFRRFYFPHPGCVVEGVALAHPENRAGAPPLATVRRMTIIGRYADLLYRPSHFDEIQLEGLQLHVPPAGERQFSWPGHMENSNVTVNSVVTKDATLEIAREGGKAPLRFDLHELRLRSLAAKSPIEYDVRMSNPMPQGELQSKGSFGPWSSGQLDGMPLYGSVQFSDTRLDDLPGIGGTLQSEAKFCGTLDAVDVRGKVTSADFHLKTAQHKIELTAEFEVIADALKGEARIEQVTAKLGQTLFRVRGSIAENAKLGRRETVLDFEIQRGRAEDALWLFNTAAKPPMIGPASGLAHVRVPKFGEGFLKHLELTGKFEIADGHFQERTQTKVNRLSARAQGVKVTEQNAAPGVAVDALDSEVRIWNGSAFFPELFFMVPGAHARLQGTYNLESHEVKMEGNLWTLAALSQASDGIKSVLLKPIDPLFKRKHAGARVAVRITGNVDEPQFTVELTRKKKPETPDTP